VVGPESTKYAESGELTCVTTLADERHQIGDFVVAITGGNILSVGYDEPGREVAALELGHTWAARLGSRLHADVVWKALSHRDGKRTLTTSYANVSIRHSVSAALPPALVGETLRRLACIQRFPDLRAADQELAAFRTSRDPTKLRDAFERIRVMAERQIPDAPEVANGALADLAKAIKQHHHGVHDPAKFKSTSLSTLDFCHARTEAILNQLIDAFCPDGTES
jgi:hypothetical protein